MWFHKAGRFAVGDNGESSISRAVHSEHLKLINCVNNMQDTRRQIRQLFFMSTQCKPLNNLRASAIHGHCCLGGPVRKSCTAVVTPSSGSVATVPDPRYIYQSRNVTKYFYFVTLLK